MTLVKFATILIVIAIAGPLLWSFRLVPESDFIVSATAFSIGIVTFFGITDLSRSASDDRLFNDETLRTAIAASLVLTYLFIVCFTSFVKSADAAGVVTREFIQSFSQVISVTIAFYFGATAATQIFAKRKESEEETKRDEQK
jgi:uncharacterized membrane protein